MLYYLLLKHRIFCGAFFRRSAKKEGVKMKEKTQKLTVSAVLIALSTVLSLIKPVDLPFGGSVTPLAMLPVMLIPIMYGVRWGFFACFVNSVIQMLLSIAEVVSWGLTPSILVSCILLDYILAYTVLGTIGFMKNKGKVLIIVGAVLSLVLRFLMHFLSGVVLFGNFEEGIWTVIWGSVTYNASYMVPEMITTSLALFALLSNKAFYKFIKR